MPVPFRFKWGTVSRIQRQDDLRTIMLIREPHAHRTALTDRDRAWVEDRLIEAVKAKLRKAQEYDLTHPLWLVVRNPYTHIAVVSKAAQRELCAANAALFDRVYCHNRKMKTLDASPPTPLVLRVL